MSKLVVKINPSSMAESGALNLRYIQIFCRTIANLTESGNQITIVSPVPNTTPTLSRNAAESVGKVELLSAFRDMFSEYNQTIALSDIQEVSELLESGVIPIIFSGNAVDAAHIAVATKADSLLILIDSDGVYNADPTKNPNAGLIREIHEITPELLQITGESNEISAAGVAMAGNIKTLFTNGNNLENISKAANGEAIGTVFVPIPQAHER